MIYKYFPEEIRHIIKSAICKTKQLEEIRVRCGQRIVFCELNNKYYIDFSGNLTQDKNSSLIADRKYIDEIIKLITKNSIYSVQNEIKNGFVTLEDGSRVGLCGKCVTANGCVDYINEITSLNFRISREVKGMAEKTYKKLCNADKNILIISPPGHGKTTFLRDFVRLLSNDNRNISVVDERCEIAPHINGNSIYDLGDNTDVVRNIPKAQGVDMVLRTMNPNIIAVDEIANDADFGAIARAMHSGVSVLATFHGKSKSDFYEKIPEKYVSDIVFDSYIYINKGAFHRQINFE